MDPTRSMEPTPGTPLPARITDSHLALVDGVARAARAARGARVTQPARGERAGQAARNTVQTGIGTVPGGRLMGTALTGTALTGTALTGTALTGTALTGTGPASTVRSRTLMARPDNRTPARVPTLPAGIHTDPRQRAMAPRRPIMVLGGAAMAPGRLDTGPEWPTMTPGRPGTGPAPGRRPLGRTGQDDRVPATVRPRQAGCRLARWDRARWDQGNTVQRRPA